MAAETNAVRITLEARGQTHVVEFDPADPPAERGKAVSVAHGLGFSLVALAHHSGYSRKQIYRFMEAYEAQSSAARTLALALPPMGGVAGHKNGTSRFCPSPDAESFVYDPPRSEPDAGTAAEAVMHLKKAT